MFQKNVKEKNVQKLLIIDSAVLDSDLLLKNRKPGYKLIRLKPDTEPISQITKAVQANAPVNEIVLVAHATPGQIHFSNKCIDAEKLEQHQHQLQEWRKSLSSNAKLCIYACQLAADEIGRKFINQLKAITGADVAASSLPIGNGQSNQNWNLDSFTTFFKVLLPFNENSLSAYQYSLEPTLTVSGNRVSELDNTGVNGNRNLEFTLSLSEATTEDVTFSYQTLSGTATEDVDFFRAADTFTILAGETTATLTVVVRGDVIDEADEDFFLELGNLSGATFADGGLTARAQGIIDDQDGAGLNRALFVDDPVIVEGDTGVRTAEFTVRLSESSSETITLGYTTADGSARAGEDYTATSGTVSFSPGQTEASVSVEVLGDTAFEGNERFSLVFTPTAAIANGVDDAVGIATIRDDDVGTLPILSVVGNRVSELDNTGVNGNRNLEFTLSLSEATTEDVTFSYQTLSGTATEDVDFFRAADTFTILAGETTATLTVVVRGDVIDEADEDFFLELGNLSGATFADGGLTARAQGIIDDQDGAGLNRALFVDDPVIVEGDTGVRTAEFTVRLSEPSNEIVSVKFTTAPGTATSGVDYIPLSGTLTFLPGQTEAAVQVDVLGDTVVEASETFLLVLSEPQGAALAEGGSGSAGIARILDDDAGGNSDPAISIDNGQIIELDNTGVNGNRGMEFVVRLSAPSSQTVTVNFVTSDGTAAVADGDYFANTGTVTFAPGETLQSFVVTARGDVLVEPDETFVVTLSNPLNATLAGGVDALDATGTIIDNDDEVPIDGFPVLSVADITVVEQPGGSIATFTLNLSNATTIAVSGQVDVAAGTATAGADFVAIANSSFVINAGELSTTVTVDILDDALVEDTETFVLRLSDIDNARLNSGADTLFAIGEITDDEAFNTAPVANDDSFNTDENTPVNGNVLLGSGADTDADGNSLQIVAVEGQASSIGTQIALTSGALLTLNANGSFDYDPNRQFENLGVGDVAEDSFTYRISDGAEGFDTATAVIAISGVNDASTLPVLTLTGSRVEELDNTGVNGNRNLEFTLSLSEATTEDVTFSYQTLSGTATEDVDFFRAADTFTILAGETTATLTVVVRGDVIDEADEDFFLELGNLSGATFADGGLTARAQGIIDDQDGAGLNRALFVDDPVIVEGDTGVRTAEFTVRLSESSSETITLGYTTADGSARAGEDYTATSGTVSFSPGQTEASVSVEVLGDTAFEGNERFSLVFTPTAAIANGVDDAVGIATIRDDDVGTLPILSVVGNRVSELDNTGVNGNRNLEFTLSLSEATTEDVTFSYQTLSGTATEDVDFFRAADTFTILAGETTATLTVVVRGDVIDEADEDFFLELGNLSGATFADGGLTARAQGIIDDQDGAGLNRALFVDDPVIVEGDTGVRTAEFTVRLSESSSETITLGYTTADGSARAGEDYTATSGTVSFSPGQTEASVSVEVLGDTAFEGNERFSLVFTPTAAIANGVDDAVGIATIRDDDVGTLPILSVVGNRVSELDNTGVNGNRNLEFTLSLSEATTEDVTFSYQTLSGTATEDVDFFRAADTFTILAGETTATLTVVVRGDVIDEADEDFFLELGNLSGATFADGGLTARAQGIIDDQDGAGLNRALFVDDPVIVEGDTGVRTAEFTVRLSEPSNEIVSVKFTTAPGTATSGVDYIPLSGTLTFLPGQTEAAVQVDVLGDTVVEASETFLLVLSEPQGAALAEGGSGSAGIARILDDDAGGNSDPAISIDNGQIIELDNTGVNGNRGMEFVVRLSAPSSQTVTVNFVTSDGTAAVADGDYFANTGTVTFAPGETLQSFVVTARGDVLVEPDETFVVTLSNPLNATLAGGVDALDATGTIIDNDDEVPIDGFPVLSVADITVVEQPGGSIATFTLNLSNATTIAVSGQVDVAAGTATAGADFVAIANSSFVINAGELSTTVTVDILDDALVEDAETFVLRLSDIDNARLNSGADTLFAIGEITDDDGGNSDVVINQQTAATIDEGGTFNRTISFTDGEDANADGWTFSVDWGDGSAAENGVVAAGASSFDINRLFVDGDASHTVSVTVTDVAGDSDTQQFQLNVDNVAPTIVLTGASEVNTGASYTLNLGAITDPGDDTVTSYVVDWGDGTSDTFTTAGDVNHVYTTTGSNTISVDLVDEDGTHMDAGTFAVVVIAAPDGVSVNAGADAAIDEGGIFNRTVTFTDGEDANADGWTYSVDWGDGSAAENGAIAAGSNSFDISRFFADGADNHTVSITVTDDAGDSDTQQFDVNVSNIAPTIALSGAPSVDEGSVYTLSLGAITDPGLDTVQSYTINWGDSTSTTLTAAEVQAAGGNVNHVFADGASNPQITVNLVDEDGTHIAAGILNVTVNDVAPTIALSGNSSVDEGSTYTLALGAITDPGLDTVQSYTINWGDGTNTTLSASEVQAAGGNVNHVFADGASSPLISVELVDEDGTHAAAGTLNLTVNNVAPTIALAGASEVNSGASYTLNLGAITDPGDDTVTSYVVDWGDGTSDTFTTAGDVNHVYTTTGSNTISVDLVDEDGTHMDAGTFAVVVIAAPDGVSVNAGADAAIDEGGIFNRTVTFTDGGDANADGWTYSVDWGDGSAAENGAIAAGSNSFDISRFFADGADNHTVSITVTDDAGDSDTQQFDVNVSNIAPTIALSGAPSVDEGSVYTLSLGAITDPGLDTVQSYTINWGDSTSTTLTAAEVQAAGGNVNHVFADGASNPQITVNLVDEDGTHIAAGILNVTVNDVAPTIALSGNSSVDEGSTYTLALGAITDPGLDTVQSYTINWGDGTNTTLSASEVQAAGGNVDHVFADGASSPLVSVDLVDEDDTHVAAGTLNVTVNNVSPMIALAGAPEVNAGVSYTLGLGAITDPGDDTVTSYVVDWGDGTSDTFNAAGDVTHVYTATGNQTISVGLVDEDGTHTDAGTLDVLVNAAPDGVAVNAGINAVVDEGGTFNRTISFTDGEDANADGWTFSVDWGDGSAVENDIIAAGANSFDISRGFGDGDASHTVSVTVTDTAGDSDTQQFQLDINNVAPTIDLLGNDSTNEGETYTLNLANLVDPGDDTVTDYIINWGDGTAATALTTAELLAAGNNVNHVFADGARSPQITVDLVDEDGTHVFAGSKTITVNNVVPTIALSGNASVDEGSIYTLPLGAITDPGTDTVTDYIIHWGDGTPDTSLTASELAAAGGSVDHVYADGVSNPLISVDLVDEDGTHAAAGTLNLTVNNVAPTIALVGASEVNSGASYTLNLGAITDPGDDTVASFIVDWGDSTSDTFTTAGDVNHVYTATGRNTISVGLVDEDGTHVNAGTLNVVVNDIPPVESIKLGDAPLRVSRSNPDVWTEAWTNERVDISHKADFSDTNELWSDVILSGRNSSVLSGGDLFGGDLGVSGQSLFSSGIRQEIDGTEALRFDLHELATTVTVDVARLQGNTGNGSFDAGRLQLFDQAGLLVDEMVFSADMQGHNKQITLTNNVGFSSVVLSAGAYNGTDFIFGGLSDGNGQYFSDPQNLGDGIWNASDYLVDAIEFEFGEITLVGVDV